MKVIARLSGLASLLLLAACAKTTLVFLPNSVKGAVKPKAPEEVSVLYDGPGRPYDVLGLLQARRYQPGYSDPILTDVLPEIKIKAAEAGADAIIIRKGDSAKRTIDIHAEVIRFRD
jgi:hypothetical protein